MPIAVLVRGRTSPARCAYCHDELALEPLTRCLRCGSAAHVECRVELAGCPTLACGERPRIAIAPRARRSWLHDVAEVGQILGLLSLVMLAGICVSDPWARLDVTIQSGGGRVEREPTWNGASDTGTEPTSRNGLRNTGMRYLGSEGDPRTGEPVYQDDGGNYVLEDGTPVPADRVV